MSQVSHQERLKWSENCPDDCLFPFFKRGVWAFFLPEAWRVIGEDQIKTSISDNSFCELRIHFHNTRNLSEVHISFYRWKKVAIPVLDCFLDVQGWNYAKTKVGK